MKELVRFGARRLISVIALITLCCIANLILKPVDRTEESVVIHIQYASIGIHDSCSCNDTSDLVLFEFNGKQYFSQDSKTVLKCRQFVGRAIQCKRITIKSIFGNITESFIFE